MILTTKDCDKTLGRRYDFNTNPDRNFGAKINSEFFDEMRFRFALIVISAIIKDV